MLVYSYAALNFLYMRYNRNTIFEQFSNATVKDDVPTEEKSVESEHNPLRRRRVMRRPQSFVTNW